MRFIPVIDSAEQSTNTSLLGGEVIMNGHIKNIRSPMFWITACHNPVESFFIFKAQEMIWKFSAIHQKETYHLKLCLLKEHDSQFITQHGSSILSVLIKTD